MNKNKCKSGKNYYTKIENAKVYVDYHNKRLKIIDFNNISVENIKRIIRFSINQRLGKIICNCDIEFVEIFDKAKFEIEGKIKGYFKGKDAICMSYFIDSNRKICDNYPEKDLLVKKCLDVKNTFSNTNSNDIYTIRDANENDINQMIKLFTSVFSTYPSPIYDEEYLKQTMVRNVLYKVAVYNEKIVGVASADMDKENLNAEITDCATYPEYRGKCILSNIINCLESDLKNMEFITLYSLSRAINPNINIVLSKHNYNFAGRLVKNCTICGAFEDMNIWVKNIN